MHPQPIPDHDTCTTHTIGRAMILAQECPPATERASQEIAIVAGCITLAMILMVLIEWTGRGNP